MTQKEVRELLQNAADPEWFKNYEFKWEPSYLGIKIELKGYAEVFQYIDRQASGWEKVKTELPSQLEKSKEYFVSTRKELVNFLQNKRKTESIGDLSFYEAKPDIQDPNDVHYLPFQVPEVPFLIELSYQSEEYFEGAYDLLIEKNLNLNQVTADYMTGALMAYEFRHQEDSRIVKRRNVEKSSIARLRNEFEHYYEKTETHVNEYLANNKSKVEKHAVQMDDLKQEKDEMFEKWFSEVSSSETKFNSQSHERIKELEELYQEKLKLEAPAKYWSDRALKLNSEGKKWLFALIASGAIAIISLGIVLYFISDGTLAELFEKTGSAIRWSLVFITFVSFLAYGIKTFAKLTFSAYHLVRDAEEREQLVYVYLALVKEKGVDDTERHLIMQSIFSRADTGLLRDDSSPTMPGNIVDKFMAR